MKIGDPEYMKLAAGTREELERVNITRAIISDEFYSEKKGDRHVRAIKRLAKMDAPIYSEHNIAWTLIEQTVSIKCPYCESEMKNDKCGSGNGYHTTSNFRCPCGAEASLKIGEYGLYFRKKD